MGAGPVGEPVAGTVADEAEAEAGAEAADIAAAELVDMAGSGAGRDAREDDPDADVACAGVGELIHESLDSGEAKTTGAPTPRTDDSDDNEDDAAVKAGAVSSAVALAVASADGRGVQNDGK